MVRNTSTGGDDYGAVGITFVRSTGNVTASGNRVWLNRAVSIDYGWDGGAFEIYGASNVTITGNRTWDNDIVIETGTDNLPCSNNVFSRNVSYGATTAGRSFGVYLRCAENMKIMNNTFYNLDSWVFSIGPVGGNFGSSIDGLQIINNVSVMAAGKIYGIEMTLPASVVIDHNVVYQSAGGTIASVAGHGSTNSLATLQAWTGREMHGVGGNPRFIDAGQQDFRLSSTSPAIDKGMDLPGITDSYTGSAPDLGRYEYGS
jgi:hypothetical protein